MNFNRRFLNIFTQLAAGRILEWQRGRIFDKEVASVFLDIVKKGQVAEVVCVEKKEKAKQRPLALNTVELLRIASSRLGIGPQQTMHVAEKLYIQVRCLTLFFRDGRSGE